MSESLIENQKTGRGGKRDGAGRKKGVMEPHTYALMKSKTRLLERIAKNTDRLINAQLNKALGETLLMVKRTERDGKGKILRVYHEIVTDPQTIIDYLDGELEDGDPIHDDENYYYMTVKPADNQAIQGLLDRGFGKAKESVESTGDQTLTIVTRHAGSQDGDDA